MAVHPTVIPGLLIVDLPVHRDNRGWFKENWQRAKMTALGLPDFGPVQQNISFNGDVGTTRGIHAEPWDKFVSVATGRIFGAWVDLREGPAFGSSVTLEMGPDQAVFVPRGVGNAYQTLEHDTAYAYLVNAHWRPDAEYQFVNLADETVAIEWPIALESAELSDKDRAHPRLASVRPVSAARPVVIGGNGQLGRALRRLIPDATFLTRAELDVSDASALESLDLSGCSAIINAAAYTNVDGAETTAGRATAWQVNATAVGALAGLAARLGVPFVTVSSDYVFDGTVESHAEDEAYSPLGVYGQSKAAGELAARAAPRHYIVRTSWVVGDGPNFVRTMASLAAKGVDPQVICDQQGRLTFADDLARGILHLLSSEAPSGVYNLSSSGPVMSWFDVARAVFELTGHDPERVVATTAEAYASGRGAVTTAPRPRHSAFDLGRLEATGFVPRDTVVALREYLAG
ncbi:sugar nucleotide-binding protein [Agromyces sp. SYSU K20354]|uniref:sugar nucleotide-binding protein n=1 Tax=Agromyces cavernae TaxID=2898659 RepID=UPI001E559B97|nr:bifunctional dTDP-4-dehydrorhamnose 3,5-epimerase family protein/NAD(P)-dependent oxidoreductase [Agromyces cavernae]MCD2444221.1 sugar nucleotide-binding protein [Agromyces cavernae]